MQKRHVLSVMIGLALTSLLAGASVALAEERKCTGTIGAVTLDNVLVPDGRSCTLNGTRLKGTLKVSTRATLSASGVRVNGNIQAEGAKAVYVNPGSIVGGNIQIKQGGKARIDSVDVLGDLQLESNRGALRVTDTQVEGNLQVFQNTGGVTLLDNIIAENLQCKENSPPPTGGGNIAGDKEDQCANL
ncbi:MAG: hypothetical protein ACRERD_08135 [Candidatus Binatia bacterium]